ncbi:MAG: tetratricopeptide repeat protein, partial [Thermodesulfobacteria bacterium]|nr:tetratricopeptide repeat protein [Thermodesulfobacteriota bacterium]
MAVYPFKIRRFMHLIALLAMLLLLCGLVVNVHAEEQKCVARLVSLQGQVKVKKASQSVWQGARLGQCVEIGTIISAGTNSRAALILNSGSLVRLDENSSLVITKELEEGFLIRMIEGIVHFFSVHPRSMKVVTPFLNAAIEGTEFIFEQTPRKTTVIVLSGKVLAQNPGGRAVLGPGEGATATRLKPPATYQVSNLIRYVQWALYYPAILDQASIIKKYQLTGLNTPLELYKKGRIAEAIQAFNAIEKRRGLSPVERALLASLLLAVGQVEKANQQIEKALGANSRLAPALALKAIIALCLHDTKKATFFSKKALEAEPDSASALIASSYVLQSEARLEDATSVAEKATRLEPENGIARIRLSELRLCLGELDRARKEAARALALNPNLSRARTLFGFIQLLNMERKEATRHFNQAIELDPADPLPRLGLGLSFIKGGRLKEGLRQLQIATGLNPGNSLIRSYLGKAYFSINRPAKALEELDLAQRLDPNDPTPWFYEAICLVNMNQPGKALMSLARSIELNANRAIYRSRLLLGQDLGVRGSALARIYGELGFEQLALLQGWKSLDYDPASYAAHRFLADTYSALPRHEIARVSELLRSQLLQPLNITPVQPHLAESKHFFHVDTGPFSPGYNEYTPLFMWNRTAFMASGLVGTRDSVGDEVTLAALGDRYSVSLGQFHYETDGFRPNNQQYHDIYNVFTQTALSHDLSLQAEYRYSRISSGDLFLRFDPDNYIPDLDQKRRRHDLRLGARYSQTPSSTFI